MKKLIPVVLICLFLFSCKKDKIDNSNTDSSIVGTWSVKSSTLSYYDKNDKLLGIDTTEQNKVVFKSDGTITGTLDEDLKEKTTYKVTNVSGKKMLTIASDGGPIGKATSVTYEILSLTDHDLHFKSDNIYYLYEGFIDTYNGQPYTKLIEELKATR